ncbi:AMP-binding protein [Citricoccus nitrophenolicus]|uniref:O-succinylbenzoic acid--CoA ligase n=1 Tax=Citricoccus muralis TaxID=169134 RepID=A0A3D9LE82_9MICC|nr:AMP-binding protein [Citricoccus muralis]REE03984.1 O-succinylbenzoic acid--CoA ligase [Citricoccus muralis]
MPVTPADLDRAQRALAAALEGSGPPVEFTEDGRVLSRPEAADPAAGGAEGTVAVVRTSGSTGTPKQTLLTREALAASAAATASRIGGEGQWLLAVGLHYVAGLAVLSRSIAAGTTPVPLAPGPFTPQSFAEAVDRMERGTGFRALSLVPTMLSRLLVPNAGPGTLGAGFAGSAVDALRTFDAILIGGARLPDRVREAAAEAGLRIHLTYGMSETCGGCVYDGVPLDGVTADLVTDPDGGDHPGVPRLRLSGPMVAAGYFNEADRTAQHFGAGPGRATGTSAGSGQDAGPGGRTRWFLTEDTGTVNGPPGRQHLTVTGRVDDVINTGGVKVSAARVQQVLETLPGVRAAFVGAVRDDEWGQRVCAAVAEDQNRPPFDQAAAREAIRAQLGPAAVPKQWLVLEALPLLPNGKTDRQALLTRFST